MREMVLPGMAETCRYEDYCITIARVGTTQGGTPRTRVAVPDVARWSNDSMRPQGHAHIAPAYPHIKG